MKRSELEHLIRAAGAISGDSQLIVIGSQAILGQFPEAPVAVLASMEADIYPRNKPALAEVVDGAIGEGSYFHRQFGYYAQGVGPETAVLPTGWERRLIPIENANTGGTRGLCLEAHDLAISKYVAGRPKDLDFNKALARHGMTRQKTLLDRLRQTRLDNRTRGLVRARISADFPASPAR
jgi:hypothetical protein